MSFAPAATLLTEVSDLPEVSTRLTGRVEGAQLLVPLVTSEAAVVTDQLRVAASLTRTAGGTLHVVDPIGVGDQTLTVYQDELTSGDEQELLEWALESVSSSESHGGTRFRQVRRLVNSLLHTIETHDIDTIVVPSDAKMGRLQRGVTGRLARRAECNVVTVNGQGGYEQVPSILLPIAGGPHSGLATDIAHRIAADWDAWIDVLHVVESNTPADQRGDPEEYVDDAYERLDRPEYTTRWVLEASDVAEAIIEQSAYYGLTVIGAPTKGRLRRFITGSTNRTIRDNARSVVLSVRNNQ